jgi:hypothetical protein
MRRVAISTTLLIAASLTIAGCSSTPAPSTNAASQSVEDGCAVVRGELATLDTADLADKLQSGDSQGVVDYLDEIGGKLGAAQEGVTNSEVTSALNDLLAGYGKLDAAAKAFVASGGSGPISDDPDFSAAGSEYQTVAGTYQELCPPTD